MEQENYQNHLDLDVIKSNISQIITPLLEKSELFLNVVPYTFDFNIQKYKGETAFPEKIIPIEKAILGILSLNEYCSLQEIGAILGFDVQKDAAEHYLLITAIDSLKKHNNIDGDNSAYSLTDEGKLFASEGKRAKTQEYEFSIWISPKHKDIVNLSNAIDDNHTEDVNGLEPCELQLDELQKYAFAQTSNVHNPNDERYLNQAELIGCSSYSYTVYICFIRNVINGTLRLLAYDNYKACFLDEITTIFNKDEILKETLLDKIEQDSSFIPEESISEDNAKSLDDVNETIEIEVNEGDKILKLHKRALYDELMFETEISNIFNLDKPDEIWMISPWIGYYFVESRLPLIEKALKNGTRVFIAHSKKDPRDKSHPEKLMVNPVAQRAIEGLEKQYSNFYSVELPNAFHTKNVFEVKAGQIIMFSGSFNVLSFAVNQKEHIIRGEQMVFVNPQRAKTMYRDYVIMFAQYYIEETKKKIDTLDNKTLSKFDEPRIAYFKSIPELAQSLEELCDEIDYKKTSAQTDLWVEELRSYQKSLGPVIASGIITSQDKAFFSKAFISMNKKARMLDLSSDLIDKLNQLQTEVSNLRVSDIATNALSEEGKAISGSAIKGNTQLSDFDKKVLELYPKTNFNDVKELRLTLISLLALWMNNHKNAKRLKINPNQIESCISTLFENDNNQSMCRINITNDKFDKTNSKSRLFIVCENYLLVFNSIIIRNTVKNKLMSIRQYIDLKDSSITEVTVDNVKELLTT